MSKNSDSLGRADIEKTMKNAMDTIRENEESTLGGLLGNTNGTKSIGNSFSLEHYLKICGIDSVESFQKLLDEKIDPPRSTESQAPTTNNDSILSIKRN